MKDINTNTILNKQNQKLRLFLYQINQLLQTHYLY